MIQGEIIIDTRSKSQKGYPLKIRVYCTKLKKHRYIALKKYQSSKKLKISDDIAKREVLLQKELDYCNDYNLNMIESLEVLKNGLPNTRQTKLLIPYLDEVIKERIDRGMSETAFKDIQREFRNYGQNLPISQINYEWVKKFITYKKKTGTGEGGISYYIRTASTVFNEAVKLGLVDQNPFKGHRIKRKRTTLLELPSWEQIRCLNDYKPEARNKTNAKNMKRAADLFLFQIHIGGHYISDVGNLEIKNNRVYFQRYKNRSKEQGGEVVDNMLTDFAKEFLDTYGLEWIPNPKDKYKFTLFRNNYNKTLKRISLALEIKPKLESSMPRYLFKTAGGECGANYVAQHQLMGHKLKEIHYGYQGSLPYEILDKEHYKILDYLFLSRSL